ncbi:MAG TPA: LCP family protein [Candidatus Saccharimonadales bacterium]|nr:LCP family protein [Candidatus Saccharimonadales bacterium]
MNFDSDTERLRLRQTKTIDGFVSGRVGPNTLRRPYVVTPAPQQRPLQLTPQPAVRSSRTRRQALFLGGAAAPKEKPQIARSLPPIDMSLPGAAQLLKQRPTIRRRKLYGLRTWLFRSTVTAMILVIGIGGFLFAQGYLKMHRMFGNGATAAALQNNVNPNKLKGEGDGRINILLMGMGGAGHDAPDLTDTMMIASIDPVNHKASLLSIPRDMWVNIPNAGSMKLNAAYETGKYKYLGRIDNSNSNKNAVQAGFNLADQTVEDITGITIHYNVLVDFTAFRKAIDTVGGVQVNVPEQLYDPTMAWENNWNPVLAKKGVQTFKGKKALIYVRSRETTSDFARSERQRAVLVALKEKIVTLGTLSNPLKISELMNAFGNNVHTDLSMSDTAALYGIFKDIPGNKITSLGLSTPPHDFVTTDTVGGQSVVRPKLGFYQYKDIRNYVRGALPDGYIVKENAKLTVLNGTVMEGLATDVSDTLKSYGYKVTKTDNAPTNTYDDTVVVDLTHGQKKYTKHYLEQRFGVKATTKIPDSAILPNQADFIIILGNNEATHSEN